MMTEHVRQLSGTQLCFVHVALDFTQRDRGWGQRSVGMENRIIRILPPLVGQTACRALTIIDEPVSVTITIGIDPRQGSLDIRPKPRDKVPVSGALVVMAGQNEPERCRINRSIIRTKWDFSQRDHFALPLLMQN